MQGVCFVAYLLLWLFCCFCCLHFVGVLLFKFVCAFLVRGWFVYIMVISISYLCCSLQAVYVFGGWLVTWFSDSSINTHVQSMDQYGALPMCIPREQWWPLTYLEGCWLVFVRPEMVGETKCNQDMEMPTTVTADVSYNCGSVVCNRSVRNPIASYALMTALQVLATIALIVCFLVKLFHLFIGTHSRLSAVSDPYDRSSPDVRFACSTWYIRVVVNSSLTFCLYTTVA
jgi:hypothetical protein